jgi:hypothetical protein
MSLGLRHAVAYGLAAAKLDLFTIATGGQRVVLLDFNQQAGVGQSHPVAHGGAEDFRVGAASNGGHHISGMPVGTPQAMAIMGKYGASPRRYCVGSY